MRADPSLTSEEKLALEFVKMPSATENFTRLLSSKDHLASYVSHNFRHRAPLNGAIIQGREPSVVRKMGRGPHRIRIINNALFGPKQKVLDFIIYSCQEPCLIFPY